MENAKTRNLDIAAFVKRNAKKNIGKCYALSLVFLFISIACCALGFFSVIIFFVAVPCFLIPFLHSVQAGMDGCRGNYEVNNKHLFNLYGLYMNRRSPVYGSYRFWTGFLKAFVTYVIVIYAFIIVYVSLNQETFRPIMDQLYAMFNEGDLDGILNLVQTNSVLTTCMNLSSVIALGAASFMFIHHIGTGMSLFGSRLSYGMFGAKETTRILKDAIRNCRSEYLRDYYHFYLPYIIIFLLLFIGGTTFGLLRGLDGETSYMIGISAILVVLSFSLPRLCLINTGIVLKYELYIKEEFVKTFEKFEPDLLKEAGSNPEFLKNFEFVKKSALDSKITLFNDFDLDEKD